MKKILSAILYAGLAAAGAAPARAQPAVIQDVALPDAPHHYTEKDIKPECIKTIQEESPTAMLANLQPYIEICVADMHDILTSHSNTAYMDCTANVHYPAISGTRNAAAMNAAITALAKPYHCALGTSTVRLEYKVTHNSDRLLSLDFYGSNYEIGTGGSCHGNEMVMTFDITTGKVLRLSDVIRPTQKEQLKAYIANYITHFPNNPISENAESANMVRNELLQSFDRKFSAYGIYLVNGTVMTNINEYVYSCVAGPSWPVPIPRKYIIHPAILAEMH